MTKRRAANIAFALLLTAIFCGLAKRTVSAAPLQWHDLGHYREAKVNRPVGQASGFTLLSAKATGVEFTNRLARARMINANLLNGGGVAAGDVDGDGLCDLYFCSLDDDNALGQPGLRVRLKFNGGTVSSQGAVLRPVYRDGSKGPVRLVSGSSGRYSRNSDTQILGAAGRIRSVEVTWPNGMKRGEKVTDPARLLELSAE